MKIKGQKSRIRLTSEGPILADWPSYARAHSRSPSRLCSGKNKMIGAAEASSIAKRASERTRDSLAATQAGGGGGGGGGSDMETGADTGPPPLFSYPPRSLTLSLAAATFASPPFSPSLDGCARSLYRLTSVKPSLVEIPRFSSQFPFDKTVLLHPTGLPCGSNDIPMSFVSPILFGPYPFHNNCHTLS